MWLSKWGCEDLITRATTKGIAPVGAFDSLQKALGAAANPTIRALIIDPDLNPVMGKTLSRAPRDFTLPQQLSFPFVDFGYLPLEIRGLMLIAESYMASQISEVHRNGRHTKIPCDYAHPIAGVPE